MQVVELEGEFITLAQFLKKVDLVSSGGEVKSLLATQVVLVNGLREERRGRKLRQSDQVRIGDRTYRLESGHAD